MKAKSGGPRAGQLESALPAAQLGLEEEERAMMVDAHKSEGGGGPVGGGGGNHRLEINALYLSTKMTRARMAAIDLWAEGARGHTHAWGCRGYGHCDDAQVWWRLQRSIRARAQRVASRT